jgi:type IV pilus assembly protein PilE
MSGRTGPRRLTGGFSLIELMVAIAIVGVLAAIAVPSYRTYVLQAHRTDAVRTLTSYRQALERCYSQNFTYVNAVTTPCPAATGAATTSPNGYYNVTFTVTAAPPAYTILATATGTQVKDTNCASMQVTSAGAQTALNSAGADSTQICWGGK